VFLMLVEANRQLRAEGVQGPDLMAMLDLVALATVADVAPLIGVNRALRAAGAAVMARRERPGLWRWPMWRGWTQAPTAYHLGFVLGPRVNAGGRIGRADLGARLLATDDPAEAQALARPAGRAEHRTARDRGAVREAALAQAEARGLDAPLVWAAGEGWHPGVVGIVAARLKEATNRPAVVIGLEGDGARDRAGRSPGSTSARRSSGCGRRAAGQGRRAPDGRGPDREPTQLEPAMARLAELLARQGAGALGPRDLTLDGS
jgi:single-stranded-DNA-specific exonuclease